MVPVFADASYWIARLNERDSFHEIAVLFSESLGTWRVVISELVLSEVLNFFPEFGPAKRRAAVTLARELQESIHVEVVSLSDVPFWDVVDYYDARPDQEWGLVDCSSFRLMAALNIREALTNDHHFTQAGFTILMQ